MNRSILKSNSSPSQTKVSTVENDKLPDFIRKTRSDTQGLRHKDHSKGIIRAKSSDKSAKKVQFLDAIVDEIEQKSPFPRLVDYDEDGGTSDFRNLLDSVNDLNLAQINGKNDHLLALLSVVPPEIADDQEDFIQANTNILTSKMTSIELVVVGFLVALFFIMILKQFRHDWQSPSKYAPPLTGSEILTLMGNNIKRLCNIWKWK